MIIEEKDFRLTPVNDSSPMFDLELLHIVKPKGGEPREEFKVAGYGLPLEAVVKRIISFRIQSKRGDETISLKEYLEDCKQIQKEIKEICMQN
jgi:hypothetical protein